MGKKIGIVAPSSPTKIERINKGANKLESLGYEVVRGMSVNNSFLNYLSGDDNTRANDINSFFSRDDIEMIICQNGGYGTPRIVDKIDYEMIKENKKVFSGFSDITLLLNTIYMKTGLVTYHGPMLSVDFASNYQELHISTFFDIVNDSVVEINSINHPNMTTINEGYVEGILVGGNLSLLNVFASMEIGNYFDGKILLIEEVKEPNYRLDRMLQTLRLKGAFENLKGVIVGGISGEETPQKGSIEVFKDVFKDYTYPIIFNAPIGHVTPRVTVAIGGYVMLDATNKNIKAMKVKK